MHMRLLFLLFTVAMMTGCHGGLHVPDNWRESPDASDTSVAKLQVILCFGPVTSNHSVLRLQQSNNAITFWDPGGMYGSEANRSHDLVLVDQPTAEQFWEFRRDAAGEIFHLVYEWDLSSTRADELAAVLHDIDTFETGRAGGGCCKAICEFFQLHAPDLADVPKRWLFPHALAKHLWTQPVDRVRLLQKNEDPRVYVRAASE